MEQLTEEGVEDVSIEDIHTGLQEGLYLCLSCYLTWNSGGNEGSITTVSSPT